MDDSDHDLMRRVRSGDALAFERLVRRWEPPVARVLARYAGENGEVEDLAQEVFLRVYGARDRYRAKGAFSTWLFRIVLNVARSAHRRRRLPWQSLDDQQPASAEGAIDRAVDRREQSRLVEAAVGALPPRLRDVLVLKQFGELTFAEVARVAGLPVSTVKSRVRAALGRLRAELKRRGIDPEGIES
ncbi:MAG: RNA polymerase sigma factor [Planctomycetota bacterium]|jgi:RNA polymerase sigma-70 factor (ECF subfamily)